MSLRAISNLNDTELVRKLLGSELNKSSFTINSVLGESQVPAEFDLCKLDGHDIGIAVVSKFASKYIVTIKLQKTYKSVKYSSSFVFNETIKYLQFDFSEILNCYVLNVATTTGVKSTLILQDKGKLLAFSELWNSLSLHCRDYLKSELYYNNDEFVLHEFESDVERVVTILDCDKDTLTVRFTGNQSLIVDNSWSLRQQPYLILLI